MGGSRHALAPVCWEKPALVSVHADAPQAGNKSSSDKLIISSLEGGGLSQRGAAQQRAAPG